MSLLNFYKNASKEESLDSFLFTFQIYTYLNHSFMSFYFRYKTIVRLGPKDKYVFINAKLFLSNEIMLNAKLWCFFPELVRHKYHFL